MTDFLKIAKSLVVHFAHICAYGIETVKRNCYIIRNFTIKSLNYMSPDLRNWTMLWEI